MAGGVSHIPPMALIVPSLTVLRRACFRCAVFALMLAGCTTIRDESVSHAPDSTVAVTPADSLVADTIAVAPFEPRYQRFAVRNPRRLQALLDSIGPANAFEVLKLNRVDLAHVRDRRAHV